MVHLNRIILIVLSSFILCVQIQAQSTLNLFESVAISDNERSDLTSIIGFEEYIVLDIREQNLRQINNQNEQNLSLQIPLSTTEVIQLTLDKNEVLGPGFQVTSGSSGRAVSYKPGQHFFGKVDNTNRSMAGMSIFDDYVIGVVAYEGNNYNLEPLSLRNSGYDNSRYILYRDNDIPTPFSFTCDTGSADIGPTSSGNLTEAEDTNKSLAAVGIYMECDYRMYQDNGSSIPATTAWTTAMMNVVIGLFTTAFTNSGATSSSLNISQIVVWDVQDPYGTTVAANTSAEILNNLTCNLTTYNGRIAHLLSTTNAHGGIAQKPSGNSCIDENPNYGYSSIANSYNANLNIYSWTVNVVAHEIGHQLSSCHTHDCVWNGNNTQIDDCGNEYLDSLGETPGGCYDSANPVFPALGTIMSYCHASPSGGGVDLSVGFNPQVEMQIGNYVENCMGTTVSGCSGPTTADFSISVIDQTTATLTTTLTAGIASYFWEYRVAGTNNWMDSGVISTTSYTATGLQTNTTYEVHLYVYCSVANTWSSASCNEMFVTGNCPTSYSVAGGTDLTGNQTSSVDYETDGIIESTQNISNSITVDYDSKLSIALMPGFQCKRTVAFTVFIDGCGNLVQQAIQDKK